MKGDDTVKTLGEAFNLKGWKEAEAEFHQRYNKPVPKGWYTTGDYAKERGMNRSAAANRLKMMYEAKILERQEWRVGNAKSYIYRPKPK